MTPEEFNQIITECWESIAFIAFDGFQRMGRGIVALMDDQDSLEKSYHAYTEEQFDSRTIQLIKEYDPAWEILVQYIQPEGEVTTLRIRTRPDQRHPWRIWMYSRLEAEDD